MQKIYKLPDNRLARWEGTFESFPVILLLRPLGKTKDGGVPPLERFREKEVTFYKELPDEDR